MKPSLSHQRNTRPRFLLRGSLLAAGVALMIIVSGVALLGYSYDRYYAGRIFPGVTILDQAMGGQTYREARATVLARANQLLDESITLMRADNQAEIITPRSVGFTLEADVLVYQAYARGRTGSVLDRGIEMLLLQISGAAFAFSPEIDADHILERLEEKLVTYEQPVQEASLSVSASGVTLTAGQAGVRVDRAEVARQIEDILTELKLPAEILITTEAILPTITEDDLRPLLAEATRLADPAITIVAEGRRYSLDEQTIMGWLVYDPTASAKHALGQMTWNNELISGTVAGIAKKVDVPMFPKKINAQNGAVLEDGTAGVRLNRAQVTAAITKILEERRATAGLTTLAAPTITAQVDEVSIEEKTVTPPFTPGLYAGKYVEINLSEQTLYQWEGTNLVASYTVSTGKWSAPTPQGVLYIKNHISYAYSRKYDLYMPWWLGLSWNADGSGYEGYGIHELPEWKGGKKEGEAHLGTPVSHGCIRLGIGPAEAIYSWAEEGMPVYIHK
jgi:lipoprotein-anchoring transpeptidase ErfK/SrfK